MKRTFTLAAALLAAGLASAPASAANLVGNGGFETGDFTGWTLGGTPNAERVSSSDPFYGTYSARLGGAARTPGYIEQTVDTVAGTEYVLFFVLANDPAIASFFSASVDGIDVTSLTNSSAFSYHPTILTFVADGASVLRFSFRHQPAQGYFHLDDVIVEENALIPPASAFLEADPVVFNELVAAADTVPEPGILVLIGIALAAMAVAPSAWRRFRPGPAALLQA